MFWNKIEKVVMSLGFENSCKVQNEYAYACESADKILQHHLSSLIVRMLVSQGKPRFPRRWPRFLTYEDKDGTKEEPKKKKSQIAFQTAVHNLFPNFCYINM